MADFNPFDYIESNPAPSAEFNPFDYVKEPDVEQPAPPPPSGIIRRAADVPLGLLKGAIGLPEAAVGLADMVTGGYAGKGAEYLGFRPKEAKEIINTWQSPELNQARENVQSAKGFVPTLGAMVQNPSTIVDAAAESAPSMIGGAGIARGAMKLAPKISGALAAGIGEGVVTAGSSAEQVRQETPDGLLTAKQMIAPAISGALTGGLGVMGGKIAQKLGIADIDTMLATGAIKQSDHGLLRRVAEGAFSEGILEELPQSAQEQALQNIALNKPWNEGVAEAAASGMLVGGIMGGGGNVLSSVPVKNDIESDLAARTPEAPQEAAPIAPVKTGNPLSDALATVAPSPVTARPDAEMEAALSEPQVNTPASVGVPEKGAPVQGLPAEVPMINGFPATDYDENGVPLPFSDAEAAMKAQPKPVSTDPMQAAYDTWLAGLPNARRNSLMKYAGTDSGAKRIKNLFAKSPEYAAVTEATNVENAQTPISEVAPVGQDLPLSRELPVVSEEPAVSPPESAGVSGESEVALQNTQVPAMPEAVSEYIKGENIDVSQESGNINTVQSGKVADQLSDGAIDRMDGKTSNTSPLGKELSSTSMGVGAQARNNGVEGIYTVPDPISSTTGRSGLSEKVGDGRTDNSTDMESAGSSKGSMADVSTGSRTNGKPAGSVLENNGSDGADLAKFSLAAASTTTGNKSAKRNGIAKEITGNIDTNIRAQDKALMAKLSLIPMEVKGANSDIIRNIAARFNQRVLFYKADGKANAQQQGNEERGGFILKKRGDTIYLNVESPTHLNFVIGHEIVHVMGIKNRMAFNQMWEGVRQYVDETKLEQYEAELEKLDAYKGEDSIYKYEEFLGDLMGEMFMDRRPWATMAVENPSLFRRIATAILKMYDKISSYVGIGRDASGVVTDLDAAYRELIKGLYAYAEKPNNVLSPEMQAALDVGEIRYQQSSRAIPTSRADFTDTIKSAIQNTPLFDRLATNIFDNGMVVSRWGRSVGTMYHIASKKGNEEFKRVFDLGQQFITDINSFAAKAEALAPNIFPKFGIGAGMLKSVSKADNALISKALFEGTLANGASPTSGVIWSDKELTEKYGMSKEQRTMYHEARAAVNRSLDDMAKSTIFTTALRAKVGNDFRRYKEDSVDSVAKRINAEIQGKIDELYKVIDAKGFDAFNNKKDSDVAKFDKLKDFQKSINKVASTTDSLKSHGYFPLSRFGDHTVTVKDAEGKTVYYGMYEGPHDAVKAMRTLAKDFPNHNIKRGRVSKEAYKIYGGLTLEAVELFAEHMDKEDTKPYQDYLKNAVNNRSAMKHMINRKGTAGYSSDGVRTLANFIYSNARFASKNLNMKLMGQAANDMPDNDLKDMAIKLKEYLNNPVEEFSKLRGFMFIHYLGGSIASGITNMTQVVLMLAPYLAQNTSAANVVKQVTAASKDAFTSPNKLKKPDERKLMMELDEEGETAPQEIHQLSAIASNRLGASNPVWNAGLRAWGSIFSVTEIFNRRTTALSAYRIAVENGKLYEEAKAEAVKAIKETQGIYSKANRPMWGRGVLGAPLFTFKQFSVMYLELFARLPAKQKLMMLGLLMMASGAEGLPFAGDLEDLIDTIGQWLGYGTNSKRWIKEKVGGTPVGDFFLKGVSSVAPIDVQGRLGMNNLIPGTAILKQSSTDKGRDVKEFFGPMGGLFTAASDSLELLAKGQVARAVKAASPRAIQGIATGAEMALTGKATDKYGRKTFDATPVEAAEKFVGFNPSRMAEESQVKMGLMQDKQLLTVRTEEIVNDMAQAKIDRDAKAQREAMDKWRKWNADNPDLKIPAIHTKVANRIKVLRSTSADRFKKSMPKDQRAAIARELS